MFEAVNDYTHIFPVRFSRDLVSRYVHSVQSLLIEARGIRTLVLLRHTPTVGGSLDETNKTDFVCCSFLY